MQRRHAALMLMLFCRLARQRRQMLALLPWRVDADERYAITAQRLDDIF